MADFFEWDAGKYALQIPRIDDEHQEIIAAMNGLHAANEAKASRAKLDEIFTRLLRVTRAHFKDEEAYMEKIGYADLRKHRHMHQHLLDRLDAFHQEFAAKGELTEALFQFLKMWLKSHICGIDTQYAKHAHAA
jgi:hemerythrin-like metal-binding protein